MSYNCTCGNGATLSGIHGCHHAGGCVQCCKGKGGVNEEISGKFIGGGNPINPNPTNPANPKGMGFSTSYDGRIRGGIKTPDYISSKQLGREFNIMDDKSTYSKPMQANGSSTNTINPKPMMREGQIVRIHPLDIAKAPRRMGAIVFDPISAKWKQDDGRPRGIIFSGGKKAWGCWGKCVVKRWHGIGNKVKCPCNKSAGGNSCECSGCMSGGAC